MECPHCGEDYDNEETAYLCYRLHVSEQYHDEILDLYAQTMVRLHDALSKLRDLTPECETNIN